MHKDLNRWIRIARKQGWRVEINKKGHVVFYPPDRAQEPWNEPGTPSDSRWLKRLQHELKKRGLRSP